VNDASRADDRGCLPSCKGPSPRDALSSARLRTSRATRFGHRVLGSRRLFTPGGPLRALRGPGSRPHAPLPTGVVLLRVSAPLADFCNLIRRVGTPFEPSTLAREWGFRPATRRHQPMPVASASAVRCRTGGLRATTRTRRLACDAFRLRGRDGSRAEALEQRRTARSWTMSRVPFSWRFGHPGHRLDSA